jgi:hypothetical protein
MSARRHAQLVAPVALAIRTGLSEEEAAPPGSSVDRVIVLRPADPTR